MTVQGEGNEMFDQGIEQKHTEKDESGHYDYSMQYDCTECWRINCPLSKPTGRH